MAKVSPLRIDTELGKLPLKDKGLEMIEFESPAELRRNQLEKLVAGFRLFSYFGYDEGVAGHITFRDPEFNDHFWVNPLGVHFSQIKISDLLLVNHDGEVVQGNRPVNVAAFAIHSRLHKARPDVNAAAHSHSMYGRTFSSLGKLLDPITQDSCAFYERQAMYDHFSGVVEETEEGDKIANSNTGPWHDAAAVAKTLSKSDLTTISKFEFGKTMLGRRFAKFNCKKCKTSLKTFLDEYQEIDTCPECGLRFRLAGNAFETMHQEQEESRQAIQQAKDEKRQKKEALREEQARTEREAQEQRNIQRLMNFFRPGSFERMQEEVAPLTPAEIETERADVAKQIEASEERQMGLIRRLIGVIGFGKAETRDEIRQRLSAENYLTDLVPQPAEVQTSTRNVDGLLKAAAKLPYRTRFVERVERV